MPIGLEVQNPSDIGIQGISVDGVGVSGVSQTSPGVTGNSQAGPGVFGGATAGIGVSGESGTSIGVSGESYTSIGVSGTGPTGVSGIGGRDGIGVTGSGDFGVTGQGNTAGVTGASPFGTGVYGISTDWGVSGFGATGVRATGLKVGVQGSGAENGVIGSSLNGPGVAGFSDAQFQPAVWGSTNSVDSYGVRASNNSGGPQAWALVTDGNAAIEGGIVVVGSLDVFGVKNALVKLSGEYRRLYCVESPECWFEDFGRARLVRGRARVRLDRTFAQAVRTDDYHIFLSPEGLSHGLYVARRTRDGFEVREQHQGKSTVPFSYRIVARRKDVKAPRFDRVTVRPVPPAPPRPRAVDAAPPKLPDLPKPLRSRQLDALSKRLRRTAQRRATRRRRR